MKTRKITKTETGEILKVLQSGNAAGVLVGAIMERERKLFGVA